MNSWTEEQLEAINKEGMNIIVSAGAGSGKTAVLTERVIRKVKDGIDIDKLLILTFTKAAAEEMKDRIRKKLLKEKRFDDLDKIDKAYITTFDSFALSIVKKYHYLINISRNISIIDSSIVLIKKREFLDQIFDELYTCDSMFENLIKSFADKDDNLIKENILKVSSKLDLKYDKLEYIKEYTKRYYNEENIKSFIKKYESFLLNKISYLSSLLNQLKYVVENEYFSRVYNLITPLLNSSNYDEIKNNIDIKLPSLIKNEDGKEIKEEITGLIKEIKELTNYNKDELYIQIMTTKNNSKVILEIIYKLEEKIRKWKYSKDLYEFHDISRMAIELLHNNNWIRDEMKANYNEILLDEYQDTNDLQEMFINLFMNNNVYMVGDMKQSIYRFRNANPAIFKNKYDNYSRNIDGIKIDLTKNFRTRKEPLDDINFIFNRVMSEETTQINYKTTHQMILGNKNYDENNDYHLEFIQYEKNDEYSNEEIEVFNIISDIKNKIMNKYQIYDKDKMVKRDVKYNDFVILIDRKTSFDLYKKIFEYEELPLNILEEEKITDCNEIKLVFHILRLISKIKCNIFDEQFKYSYMSIARSYLMELPDEEIFLNIKNNDYTNIVNKIKPLISISMDDPVTLFQNIIDIFDFYNAIIKYGQVEEIIVKLDYITNLIKDLSSIGYDLNDIRDYLEKVSNDNYDIKFNRNQTSKDAVNLMTIHKSKGLEFPICYFPGLYSKFNQKDITEKFVFDDDYGLIIPSCHNELNNTILSYLLKDKYKKDELAEKIRLFYVALTRAREKIVLLFPKIEKIKNNFKINSFLDMFKMVYYDLEKYETSTTTKLTKDYLKYQKIDKDIVETNEIIVNEIPIIDSINIKNKYSKKIDTLIDIDSYNNIEYGNKIHEILETIDFINPDYTNIDEDIVKKIDKFIHSDLLKSKILNIYKEYEFIDNDNHGVIDLIIEHENHIDIVDYKLKNINDNRYKNQLNGYKNYIEKITNKKVDIYLYSILDEKLENINQD